LNQFAVFWMNTWLAKQPWIHQSLPLVITLYIMLGYNTSILAKGHVLGIMKLRHAYTDIVSSKKGLSKAISKEHIDLFRAHDMVRHGRVLTNAIEFPLGGNFNPYVAGLVKFLITSFICLHNRFSHLRQCD
jgi:hypothetical protein